MTLALLLIVHVPLRGMAVPVNVAVPSSFVIEPNAVPALVTVKLPVASVPAENTAMSFAANVVAAPVPSVSVFQFAAEVFHVPVGVVPAPVVVPLRSQYFTAACDCSRNRG